MAKFFWLLGQNTVLPTQVDNILTWDMDVVVKVMVAEIEIDFAKFLLAVIHERTFMTSTTCPFPCLIFQPCRDVGVPIWHCDRLCQPMGIMDIYRIRDDSNVAEPYRGPKIDVAPLNKNLADTVEQAQGAEPTVPEHQDPTPASSPHAGVGSLACPHQYPYLWDWSL